MKKVLIIDNGTIRLGRLESLLVGMECEVVRAEGLVVADARRADLIVLSGGSEFPIVYNEDRYRNEIDLIRNADRPIVGICLGFELIAHAYGAELVTLERRERGIVDLEVMHDSNGLFTRVPNLSVYEAHRWTVRAIPDDFIELARSADGVEAIRHRSRALYGFQFHPEMFAEITSGDEVFRNVLQEIFNT